MTTCKKLFILEGADCSGKSTLALKLAQRYSAMVVHHGPYLQFDGSALARVYVDSMLPALLGEKHVVLDRSWLSEPIYGVAYRNGADRIGPVTRRMLERLALRCDAEVVVCDPGWDAVSKRWAERKADEYIKTVEALRKVHSSYRTLVTHLPITRFDYVARADTAGDLLSFRTAGGHPLDVRTAGCWDAKVLLVGEAPGALKGEDHEYQWPFASFSEQGCSRWLTRQLDRNLIDESKLLWVNASDSLSWVKLWSSIDDREVIALGSKASAALDALDIDHTVVAHPQYHKRFQHADPYPLVQRLRSLTR